MSLNYCTIGSTTFDTFCGNQRAKVLARLLIEKNGPVVNPPDPPVRPPSGGGWAGGGAGWGSNGPRPSFNDGPPLSFEQPFITVSVRGLGDEGRETIDLTTQMALVTVTNLEIGDPTDEDITVNISDLEI